MRSQDLRESFKRGLGIDPHFRAPDIYLLLVRHTGPWLNLTFC